MRIGVSGIGSVAAAGFALDRLREQEPDGEREQPPRRDTVMLEQPGEAERHGKARRHAPVVADDEVPPETQERSDVLHARAAAGASAIRRWRSKRASPIESSPRKPMMPRIATSEPGHATPAPSPPQKMPKLESRTPTTNLSVFSGTRSR